MIQISTLLVTGRATGLRRGSKGEVGIDRVEEPRLVSRQRRPFVDGGLAERKRNFAGCFDEILGFDQDRRQKLGFVELEDAIQEVLPSLAQYVAVFVGQGENGARCQLGL